jgi:hypothetical protein
MNGKGLCYYADGEKYDGDWNDGMKNGKGICYYTNGS